MGSARLAAVIEAQRPQLALWMPVCFGLGIAFYFWLPTEPHGWMLAALGGVLAILVGTAFRVGQLARIFLILLILPIAGLAAGALRSLTVAAPVLPYEMTVPVEGRIVGLTRSASNQPRVLLDRVVIHGLEPDRTPAYVRISLGPATPTAALMPGQRILGMARLAPPGGPVEPGGFDFRLVAWFQSLGAVGYSRTPMVEMAGSDRTGLHQTAFRLRMALSEHIRSRIPGQNGTFAAAILTGDRSGIDLAVEQSLRVSTLYHLVSISGLHMSLIAAAVFGIVRYGLALVPRLALTWPLKKIAAVVALFAGFAYLVVSGVEVAAQRSYIMTAVVLVAVLLDRPALTMRSVALAALIVLLAAPESLMQAGFQMSFAATIALIAAFEGLRGLHWWQHTQTDRRWRFVKPALAVAMTSLVAGSATAPISAFHFNMMAQYGLFANLLGVPAMGLIVMPAGVVALIAAPFGLDWLPFTVMGWGIAYVLAVADFIAGLGGAVVGVPAGPGASLGLMCLGGLFFVLWSGRGRWVGLAPVALALVLWAANDRPDILVSEDGRLFGYLTTAGRVLSGDRGNSYSAEGWLQNDGDTATQAEAHSRAPLDRSRGRTAAEVPGLGRLIYLGMKNPVSANRECAAAAILIAPNWRTAPKGDCLFIGSNRLRADGAMSIDIREDGLVVTGALSRNRSRPWTRDPRELAWSRRSGLDANAAAPASARGPDQKP